MILNWLKEPTVYPFKHYDRFIHFEGKERHFVRRIPGSAICSSDRNSEVKIKTIVWGEPEIKPAEFLFLANIEAYNLEYYFQCKFVKLNRECSMRITQEQFGMLLTDTEENQENVCPDVRSWNNLNFIWRLSSQRAVNTCRIDYNNHSVIAVQV